MADEAAESEEDEAALELMPVLRATGDRVLAGVTRHRLLQRSPLGVSVYERALAGDTLRLAADACRALRAARPKSGKGEKYSHGQTYWIGMEEKPRDMLERLALDIFLKHTEDVDLEDESIQRALCGAEYWAVVCQKGDDVAPHFDKCYFVEESHRINLHPLIGTVTYLTSVGAPTVVTGVSEPYIPCLKVAEAPARLEASRDRRVPFVVSYPGAGKHITFDGQLLHYADAALALPDQAEGSERVALLANVWVNYRPKDAERRKGLASPEAELKPLMSFENRGRLRDAGSLGPRRRRKARGGGGLWFAGLFADGEAGATFWYDRQYCLGADDEEAPAPAPKKRRRRRQEAAEREAEREVLALVEGGLGVEEPGRFLTTAFEGRDECRPEGLL